LAVALGVEQTDPHRLAFGQAIRDRRREQHLSQNGAGRLWGVGRSWLSRLERGQADPSFGQLVELAEAMDASLTELFRQADALLERDADAG
jgi:transcriptional regulator with XRE-family HTH domain